MHMTAGAEEALLDQPPRRAASLRLNLFGTCCLWQRNYSVIAPFGHAAETACLLCQNPPPHASKHGGFVKPSHAALTPPSRPARGRRRKGCRPRQGSGKLNQGRYVTNRGVGIFLGPKMHTVSQLWALWRLYMMPIGIIICTKPPFCDKQARLTCTACHPGLREQPRGPRPDPQVDHAHPAGCVHASQRKQRAG